MTSLIKKRKDGRDYYYAVRSARVDGKPRIVWQKYLGPVEQVIRKLENGTPEPPEYSLSFEFGGPAALLAVAESIDLKGIIDKHVPKRDQGPSVGDYLLLCILNRVLGPTSKSKLSEWYEGTILQRLWKYPPDCFTAQHFWNHMDRIGPEQIKAIETEIAGRVIAEYKVNLDCVLYDATNFFTYIGSGNSRNTLAQRGHSKERRADLRIVGLGLVVTRAFKIPLLHQTYAGNVSDSAQFPSICVALAERMRELSKRCEDLTLVFDKGNNSADALVLGQIEHLHFVGSLSPSDHPELLDIPLEEFQQASEERWPGVRAYRTSVTAMGQEWPCVITFSEHFHSQQLQGWVAQRTKATAQLEELNREISKQGNRRKRKSIESRVQEILAPLPFRKTFSVNVVERDGGRFSLSYTSDLEAFHRFVSRRGGKTILFTDHQDWTNEEVIAAYRGQSEIESAFRLMKCDEYLHWQPMFHWTDSKIQVHAFYCVLALLLVSLLTKRLHEAGLNLPPEKILDLVSKMDETVIFYPERNGKQTTETTYTKPKPVQKKIMDVLHLNRWQVSQG